MPETGKFPMLSVISLQSPRLVVPFRQFLLVSDLRQYSPWNSNTLISAKFCISTNQQQTIPIRQSLHVKLKRYLIVFNLQTNALYQKKHTRLLLYHRNDILNHQISPVSQLSLNLLLILSKGKYRKVYIERYIR